MSSSIPEKEFTVPFVLGSKELYPVWFYEVIQEIKRSFGSIHHKYVISYLKGHDATAQLPLNEEHARIIKDNMECLAFQLVRQCIEPIFHVKPKDDEPGLTTWMHFHDYFCDMDEEEYLQFQIFWAIKLRMDPPIEYANKIIAANAFTVYDAHDLNDLQSWSYLCRRFEDYLEFTDLGEPVNISDRICKAAEHGLKASPEVMKVLRLEVLDKVDEKSSTCLYCNKKGHIEETCKKKKKAEKEKAKEYEW